MARDEVTPTSGEENLQFPTRMVSDLAGVIAAAREVAQRFERDTPWWRGHAKPEWRLQAQVHRSELYDETALIGHFVSLAPLRSHRPCPRRDDYFDWLFLAQHYGLPTPPASSRPACPPTIG
jgi:hypothetical protein